jgi:hypothetical protein
MPSISINRSISELLMFTLLGAGMSAGGAWLVFGLEQPDLRAQIAGWAAFLFFGLCALVSGSRLVLGKKTVLVLTDTSFWDRRLTETPVDWANVTHIDEKSTRTQYSRERFVTFQLNDESLVMRRATFITRWTAFANKALGFSALNITARGLAIRHDALLLLMKDYWQHALANKSTSLDA